MNIVCAGIPRSGSTRLFNIVRLGLLQNFPKENINSHWINKFRPSARGHNLLKLHEFEYKWVGYADFVFTTKRDIRAIAASALDHHPAGTYTSNLHLANGMQAEINLYHAWNKVTSYELVYEDFYIKKEQIISDIFNILKIPVDINKLLLDLSEIKNAKTHFNDDGESLMHTNHISSKTNLHFTERLAPDLLFCLESKFKNWLQENGYKLTKENSFKVFF